MYNFIILLLVGHAIVKFTTMSSTKIISLGLLALILVIFRPVETLSYVLVTNVYRMIMNTIYPQVDVVYHTRSESVFG